MRFVIGRIAHFDRPRDTRRAPIGRATADSPIRVLAQLSLLRHPGEVARRQVSSIAVASLCARVPAVNTIEHDAAGAVATQGNEFRGHAPGVTRQA